MLFRRAARYAFQKAASDPRVRDKAREAGRIALDETRNVAREKNRAYAAGRSFRRALNKLKGG